MMNKTIVLLCLAAVGCGGGGGGRDVPLEDLGEELGAATCAKIFECCDEAEIMEMFGAIQPPITTEQECSQFYSGVANGLLVPQLQASIEAGRVVYHADLVGDCIAVLEAATCQQFDGDEFLGVTCQDPIEGLVANGGACANDDECRSEYCDGDRNDGMGNVTEGTCADVPGEGMACEFDCAEGLFCHSDLATGMRTCVPKLADGSECDYDDQCQSDNCTGGDPQTGTPGTCGDAPMCDGV